MNNQGERFQNEKEMLDELSTLQLAFQAYVFE